MSTTLNDSMNNANDITTSAKHGSGGGVASAGSVLLRGVQAAAAVVSMLRVLRVVGALVRFGRTRRAPAGSLAVLGAGVAVGAGLGVLFAPRAGADVRRAILGRLKGLAHDTGRAVEKVEAGADEVQKKVDDLAGKAGEPVVLAEQELGSAVTLRPAMIKEASIGTGGPAGAGNHHPA